MNRMSREMNNLNDNAYLRRRIDRLAGHRFPALHGGVAQLFACISGLRCNEKNKKQVEHGMCYLTFAPFVAVRISEQS